MIRMGIAVIGLTTVLAVAGCSVNVDKDAKGNEKKVQIDTPFGGMHVKTDEVKASDLGMPEYPGGTVEADKDGNKSVDLNLGFGQWQFRVKAIKYVTTDSGEKVFAFYRKALSRSGDVISCKDGVPTGTPAKTSQGLTCSDGKKANFKVDSGGESLDLGRGVELKTGSPKHQKIVGLTTPSADGKTRFALVELDLPNTDSLDKKNSKDDGEQ